MTTTDDVGRLLIDAGELDVVVPPSGVAEPLVDLRDRRSADLVRSLSREHDALCTSAVDSWEIAAGLEAEGFSDRDCATYGFPDVFGLAEALFAQVPRRGSSLVTQSTRAPVSAVRSLMRGLIYALPALVGVGLIDPTRQEAVAVLLVSVATGWGWSQAWSFLGHRNLGWVGERAARSILRTGLLGGLLVVPLVVLAATRLLDASAETFMTGSAVACYMVAAGCLLVLGHDRLLLAALVPGSLAGLMFLVGAAPWGYSGQLALSAASFGVVLVSAAAITGSRAGESDRGRHLRARRLPGRADLPSAAAHLAYGVVCAAAVGLGPITLEVLRGGDAPGNWYVALPVVLSMGVAELQLERLMAQTHHLLSATASAGDFRRGVHRALMRSVAGYLMVVAVLSLGVLVVPRTGTQLPDVVLVIGYSALAGCFFLALVLVSLERVVAAAVELATGVAIYLCVSLPLPSLSDAAYALTFGTVFLALLLTAAVRLRSPIAHL
jgi:hypothetical protein